MPTHSGRRLFAHNGDPIISDPDDRELYLANRRLFPKSYWHNRYIYDVFEDGGGWEIPDIWQINEDERHEDDAEWALYVLSYYHEG